MIRVLIAEGNPFVRVGLEAILREEPNLKVVGVFGTGATALGQCAELEPDVILIDRALACAMDPRDLVTACEIPVGLLVFLDRLVEDEIFRLLSCGVSGFVAKHDDPRQLSEAIYTIATGEEVWLSPRVSRLILAPGRRKASHVQLSVRERAIIKAMASGATNRSIAADLCLSPGTVRNIVSAIYSKLGVTARPEAVAWAWKQGLIHHEDGRGESDPSNS